MEPEGTTLRTTREALAAEAERQLCSICKGPVEGFGHNAQPVNNGRCCNECNMDVVIPARWRAMARRERMEALEEALEKANRSYERAVQAVIAASKDAGTD